MLGSTWDRLNYHLLVSLSVMLEPTFYCCLYQIGMLECCGRPFVANKSSLAKSGFICKNCSTVGTVVTLIGLRFKNLMATLQSLIESSFFS